MGLFSRDPLVIDKNGGIKLNVKTVEEAEMTIRELKLKKKEYTLAKKEITTKMSAIRAEHSSEVAKQGSVLRGGGTIGKVVRTVQRASRDADRAQTAKQLEPLEEKKQLMDTFLLNIDKAILTLEQYLAKNKK